MQRIIMQLLLSLRSEESRKTILYIVCGGVAALLLLLLYFSSILLSTFALINPQIVGKLTDSVHYQAIQSVRREKDIENDFDPSHLIMIDLLDDHALARKQAHIVSFLKKHFVIRHEETKYREPEEPDGEPIEETIVYYLFANESEIMQTILAPPFSFTDQDIEAMRNMIYAQSTPLEDIPTKDLEWNGKYPMPLQGRITSGYGFRIHPITQKDDFHTGIDIVGTWHDNIISIADGTVVQVSSDEWYGNYILIRHKQEKEVFYSFYAHLYSQNVRVGQRVRQGQVIAREGGEPNKDPNVGLSTGHHLHFGIYANPNRNSHLDPIQYLYQ